MRLNRIARAVGLVAIAFYAATRGAGYLPSTSPPSLPGGLVFITAVVPLTVWAVLWLAAAALALAGAAWQQRPVFAALAGGMALLWAYGYTIEWITDGGRTYLNVGAYASMAILIAAWCALPAPQIEAEE